MAAEQSVNPLVIKSTQEALSQYVKKPQLTEKLLKKPPFRFLHDVFNAIIKDTGYFVGLYTPEELIFENIKDRDDKMAFLKKMIEVVKIITKSPTTVRASKIVCGHEPEKTNELLQLIGEVITKQLEWQSAVEQVVNNNNNNNNNNVIKTDPKESKEKVIKADIVKQEDKPKDTKNKEKQGAKPKERSGKEAKSKERPFPTGKDISPTGKEQKPRKSSLTNTNKETAITTKTAKTKETKTAKDKTEKSKSNKIKLDTKDNNSKTPSPIAVNEKEKASASSVSALEQQGKDLKEQSLEVEKIFDKVDEPTNQQNESNRTKSKPEIPIAQSPNRQHSSSHPRSITPKSNGKEDMAPQPPQSLTNLSYGHEESRKSSGSQRKNSAHSRRSSAQKVRNEIDNEHSETDRNHSKHSPETTPALEKSSLSNKTSSSRPTDGIVKRESTFTRDDSKDSAISMTTEQRPRTSLRPPSARPASARPGAPRKRNKNVEIILQPNNEIKMSGINVKLQPFGDINGAGGIDYDDDGENLVVIEDSNAVMIDNELNENAAGSNNSNILNASNELILADGGQGHLVQQILETQKELVQTSNDGAGKEKESRQSSASNRQSSGRQVDNLRDVIQNITKSVNPFGKLMDFIPEDIDAMQLEMSMWRDTYTQAVTELKREQSLTESVTEPMKNQLVQIDANIKEMRDMIDASRMKTLQNSDKILKMLTTG